MMHISGTFDYTFNVSDGPGSGARHIEGASRTGTEAHDPRLIGHAPLLVAEEYQREAWQLYSRITLTPRDRKATAQSLSFAVDRPLISMLRQGDVLHISRTVLGGLGLSILRDGELVAAAGAVSSVPLGRDVTIRHPGDLVEAAERVFQTRDREYRMHQRPIEMTIGNVTRIIDRGRPKIGAYEILVRHGAMFGLPGTEECVSIERVRVCPDTAAHRTAELMSQHEGFEMVVNDRVLRSR